MGAVTSPVGFVIVDKVDLIDDMSSGLRSDASISWGNKIMKLWILWSILPKLWWFQTNGHRVWYIESSRFLGYRTFLIHMTLILDSIGDTCSDFRTQVCTRTNSFHCRELNDTAQTPPRSYISAVLVMSAVLRVYILLGTNNKTDRILLLNDCMLGVIQKRTKR